MYTLSSLGASFTNIQNSGKIIVPRMLSLVLYWKCCPNVSAKGSYSLGHDSRSDSKPGFPRPKYEAVGPLPTESLAAASVP